VVTDVFANYGRYWAESFRLPSLTPAEVEAGVVIVGRGYLDAAIACGRGVIIAAPHLGGWEWGAIRLLMSGLPVTVAVEPLEPPEVFEWFVQFRTRLGMNVVPVGPGAGAAMLRALASGHVLCLLSDRLVGKASGVEVDFFGSKVMMPAGPVTLALRSGAPLLTAALYDGHDAGRHTLVFRAPLKLNPDDPGSLPGSESGPSETSRGQPGVGVAPVRLREKVSNGTQELARELEELISYAPTQWHLLQPNWPDDPPLRSLRSRRGRSAAGARERDSR
jgi:KDO2-lipid IV(A) lauroyltransferase